MARRHATGGPGPAGPGAHIESVESSRPRPPRGGPACEVQRYGSTGSVADSASRFARNRARRHARSPPRRRPTEACAPDPTRPCGVPGTSCAALEASTRINITSIHRDGCYPHALGAAPCDGWSGGFLRCDLRVAARRTAVSAAAHPPSIIHPSFELSREISVRYRPRTQPRRELRLPNDEVTCGCEEEVWRALRQEGEQQSGEGDGKAKARFASLRGLRQEGEESEAGHRDRSLGGPQRRRQGALEEEDRFEEGRVEEEDRFEEGRVEEEDRFEEGRSEEALEVVRTRSRRRRDRLYSSTSSVRLSPVWCAVHDETLSPHAASSARARIRDPSLQREARRQISLLGARAASPPM